MDRGIAVNAGIMLQQWNDSVYVAMQCSDQKDAITNECREENGNESKGTLYSTG